MGQNNIMFALVSTNRLLDARGSSRDRDVSVFFHLEHTSQLQLWKSAKVAGLSLRLVPLSFADLGRRCEKVKNNNGGFGPSNY